MLTMNFVGRTSHNVGLKSDPFETLPYRSTAKIVEPKSSQSESTTTYQNTTNTNLAFQIEQDY